VRLVLIGISLLLIAAIAGGNTYVRMRSDLVQQRTAIAAEWSAVDDALRQRADLVRELTDSGQKAASFPADILRQAEESRQKLSSTAPTSEKVLANEHLSTALAKILLESENHPQLQSNSGFLRLQEEIKVSEDRIAEARLKYNDSLEHYNARIQSFPQNLVAKIAGFGRNDAYFPTEHF
jgi:LemA protein